MLFKLGIAVSVLYWLIMAYAYSHQGPGSSPIIPVSEALQTSLIPIIIGALCCFVFGGFSRSPEARTEREELLAAQKAWKLQEKNNREAAKLQRKSKLREEPVMELNRPLEDDAGMALLTC